MVDFGQRHFQPAHPNLRFAVGDATRLGFREEFDLVVSFNALHWVTDQRAALASIRQALRPSGRAVLQFVCKGERQSLEAVIETTCASPRWSACFPQHRRPFLHLWPDEYRRLAEGADLRVENLESRLESWKFGSRQAFADFARVTFVEWTRNVPPARHEEFLDDVLDRYQRLGDEGDADVFHFYQMRVTLRR
jgi:SAM-dependent methyltransferase